MIPLPLTRRVRQHFPPTPPLPIAETIAREFAQLRRSLRPGARIAIGVGSRGIAHLAEIVAAVVAEVRAAGAAPFLIPAMGSHGGAAPEGQLEVLASYGITEAAMGVPIRASLEVREIGRSAEGVSVVCSTEALAADGILLINRIKPHTDFTGTLVNRSIHGYDSLPMRGDRSAPFIRRIFVRGLTRETHGNAIGIGMADATTTRLVREMDARITSINCLTALTPQGAKIPIAFDTDRDAIERMLASLPLPGPGAARIVRIADTLSLAGMEISEPLWAEARARPSLTSLTEPRTLAFDASGDLLDPR